MSKCKYRECDKPRQGFSEYCGRSHQAMAARDRKAQQMFSKAQQLEAQHDDNPDNAAHAQQPLPAQEVDCPDSQVFGGGRTMYPDGFDPDKTLYPPNHGPTMHEQQATKRGVNTVNTGPWKSASELGPHEVNRVSLPGDPDYKGVGHG